MSSKLGKFFDNFSATLQFSNNGFLYHAQKNGLHLGHLGFCNLNALSNSQNNIMGGFVGHETYE